MKNLQQILDNYGNCLIGNKSQMAIMQELDRLLKKNEYALEENQQLLKGVLNWIEFHKEMDSNYFYRYCLPALRACSELLSRKEFQEYVKHKYQTILLGDPVVTINNANDLIKAATDLNKETWYRQGAMHMLCTNKDHFHALIKELWKDTLLLITFINYCYNVENATITPKEQSQIEFDFGNDIIHTVPIKDKKLKTLRDLFLIMRSFNITNMQNDSEKLGQFLIKLLKKIPFINETSSIAKTFPCLIKEIKLCPTAHNFCKLFYHFLTSMENTQKAKTITICTKRIGEIYANNKYVLLKYAKTLYKAYVKFEICEKEHIDEKEYLSYIITTCDSINFSHKANTLKTRAHCHLINCQITSPLKFYIVPDGSVHSSGSHYTNQPHLPFPSHVINSLDKRRRKPPSPLKKNNPDFYN